MAQRGATLSRCKVLWRNVTLHCAKQADLAPKKATLRHGTLSCAIEGYFGAKFHYVALKKWTLRQRRLRWRKVTLRCAKEASVAA
jgi:hypothetical protein